MAEPAPLFHRAKWTADDRGRLVRAVMRGGDWVKHAAADLGRTEGAVLREADRLIEAGPVPPGFREAVYRTHNTRYPRKNAQRIPVAKTAAERERMARSFEAATGIAVSALVPEAQRPDPDSRAWLIVPQASPERVVIEVRAPRWMAALARKLGAKDAD